MNKALLSVTDDSVGITFSVSKSNIDMERRIVSGWATIDNVDQMGDQITAEASAEAFSKFRGNVREMHEKVAVGKVVNFNQQKFYGKDGQEYDGIYVDAYISKGAENTWQKVLDGTLGAFSIQGPVTSKRTEFRKDMEKTVNVITGYMLHELSLVDNPGNEMCNVISIQKGIDEADGIAVGVTLKNVFWCDKDEVAVVSKETDLSCHQCGGGMKNTGWFESLDGEDESASVKKILEQIKSEDDAEGGPVIMENETETEVTSVEEVVEKSVEEVNEPTLDFITKAMEEIKTTLTNLHQNGVSQEDALGDIKKSITDVEDKVEKSLEDLQAKHNELSAKFEDFKAGLDNVTKRLDSVEQGEAIQKSVDVVKDNKGVQPKNESFWSETFLPRNFD